MKNTQNVPYFSVDDPFDIVYRNNSTSTPVKPHTHNAVEIYFTLTDLPDVLLNDTVSSVSAHSLIVIPPHTVHQLFHRKATVYERYIVSVNSFWLEQVLGNHEKQMNDIFTKGKPAIIPLNNSSVSELSKELDQYLKKHKEITLLAMSDFFSLLDHLGTLISEANKNSDVPDYSISRSQQHVNKIIAYINHHITEPLSLEIIAEEFHLNKDYLGRLFKSHIHSTVGHYIAVQRSGLAQSLLKKGYTVTEVQEELGFSSYAFFQKFFKKMTGITPGQYRKRRFGA